MAGSEPVRAGAEVRQPALAATLRAIGEEPGALGREPLAGAIERAAGADGGWLARDDLRAQRALVRPPVAVEYRGTRVHVQPPSAQGILLAMALRRLAREPKGAGADAAHQAIEAIVGAFAHRDAIAGPEPEAALLAAADALALPARATGAAGPVGYFHTASVCAADADGLVVSMLVSVFDDFGAATWVPEGGFFLNNRLAGTSRDPDSPNHAAPGRRPVHTLAPALLESPGRRLAVSTPGADGQVQTLLQIVCALLDERAELATALGRPRWRSQTGRLLIEAGMDPAVHAALEARGHQLEERPAGDALFGAACAAGQDPHTGTVQAWADGRRDTAAGAW